MEPLLQGLAAGFAIAIPVGPIAVLIVDRGVKRGFRDAAMAGLGAAGADLTYATLAATLGAVVASLVRPALTPLRVVAIVALVSIAVWNLRALLAGRNSDELPDASGRRTFVTFLGLTLLNPVTVIYFASLIVGLDLSRASAVDRAIFVGAAFLASASWQLFLAASAALAGTRLGPRTRAATTVLGSVVILGFALKMAISF
ncbi:MAG: LysE family transporter [Actinomycetota bacterium]